MISERFNAKKAGFTLLEILIALFIFTILSLMMTAALHNVIEQSARTATHAERLRTLQIAFLLLSRDIEQMVNRPIRNAMGKEESAFIGRATGFTLTRTGFANPTGFTVQSTLQRLGYDWHEDGLWRNTWAVLDQAPTSQPHARRLLANVLSAKFQYLDREGHFHQEWPVEGQTKEPLPRAIKIYLSISHWGKVSQLYVVPTEINQAPA